MKVLLNSLKKNHQIRALNKEVIRENILKVWKENSILLKVTLRARMIS